MTRALRTNRQKSSGIEKTLCRHPLFISSIVLFLFFSAGCGFHLRGAGQLNSTIPELTLHSASEKGPLITSLKQWLMGSGVIITENAEITLKISNIQNNKRPIAYDSRGNTALYELTKSVSISVNHNNGETLLIPTTLNARQPYNFNEAETSAKDEEEALLEREMDAALIRQIIRQLEQLNKTHKKQ